MPYALGRNEAHGEVLTARKTRCNLTEFFRNHTNHSMAAEIVRDSQRSETFPARHEWCGRLPSRGPRLPDELPAVFGAEFGPSANEAFPNGVCYRLLQRTQKEGVWQH